MSEAWDVVQHIISSTEEFYQTNTRNDGTHIYHVKPSPDIEMNSYRGELEEGDVWYEKANETGAVLELPRSWDELLESRKGNDFM